MNNERRWFEMPLMFLDLIAVIACVGGAVFTLTLKDVSPFLYVSTAGIVLALGFALYYVVRGCRKNGSLWFRMFLLFYALSEYAQVLFSSTADPTKTSAVGVMLHAALFGALLVLAFAKDFGKVNSFLLTGGLCLVSFVLFVVALLCYEGMLEGGDNLGTILTFNTASSLTLSLTSLMMVYVKYEDKKERGSK